MEKTKIERTKLYFEVQGIRYAGFRAAVPLSFPIRAVMSNRDVLPHLTLNQLVEDLMILSHCNKNSNIYVDDSLNMYSACLVHDCYTERHK